MLKVNEKFNLFYAKSGNTMDLFLFWVIKTTLINMTFTVYVKLESWEWSRMSIVNTYIVLLNLTICAVFLIAIA